MENPHEHLIIDDSTTTSQASTEILGGGDANQGLGPQTALQSEAKYITKPFDGELTLDEPLRVTIMRDLSMIFSRGKDLLDIRPGHASANQSNSWDLWGPFVICLLLSSILTVSESNRIAVIFTSVFMMNLFGSIIITINSRSFLQILCIIGYCGAPMIIPALVHIFRIRFYTFLVSCICAAWSIKCCITPIGFRLDKEKRSLANYPIFMFYIFLYWVIMLL